MLHTTMRGGWVEVWKDIWRAHSLRAIRFHHRWMVGHGHGPHASTMPWCKAWAYDAKMHETSRVVMRIWNRAALWCGTMVDMELQASWQPTWPIGDPGWCSNQGRDGSVKPQAECVPCRFAYSFFKLLRLFAGPQSPEWSKYHWAW